MTHIQTTPTADKATTLLAQEIRSQKAGLVNAMRTRKAHPTYGVTKADLRERLAHLEGLLFAYGVQTTGHASAMLIAQAREVASESFDFSLAVIRTAVEEA